MAQNEPRPSTECQKEVQKQVLVASVVDELVSSTSVNQRGLIRILAVAKIHDLDCGSIANQFSYSTNSSYSSAAARVGSLLDAGETLVEAFGNTPQSLPRPAIKALRVADQHGILDDVYRKFLAAYVSSPSNIDQANDIRAIDMLSRLAGKTVFVLSITSFIMLFIIPQLKAMFEEFGLELPVSMQQLIAISNLFTRFWFFFPMILAGLFFVMAIRSPQFLSRYFLRWIPSQWSDPIFSKSTKEKMSLAWDVVDQSDSNSGQVEVAGKRESRVIETASSPESSSWILSKMARKSHSTSQKNWYLVLRAFSSIATGILFLFGFLMAVAFFQSLISIIQGF